MLNRLNYCPCFLQHYLYYLSTSSHHTWYWAATGLGYDITPVLFVFWASALGPVPVPCRQIMLLCGGISKSPKPVCSSSSSPFHCRFQKRGVQLCSRYKTCPNVWSALLTCMSPKSINICMRLCWRCSRLGLNARSSSKRREKNSRVRNNACYTEMEDQLYCAATLPYQTV